MMDDLLTLVRNVFRIRLNMGLYNVCETTSVV
jgi:hypothetical protein